MPIEEHQCVQRLVLRGRGEVSFAHKVIEKRFDVRRIESLGPDPPPVRRRAEGEKSANPMTIDAGGLP
jgi:hypothetical protein